MSKKIDNILRFMQSSEALWGVTFVRDSSSTVNPEFRQSYAVLSQEKRDKLSVSIYQICSLFIQLIFKNHLNNSHDLQNIAQLLDDVYTKSVEHNEPVKFLKLLQDMGVEKSVQQRLLETYDHLLYASLAQTAMIDIAVPGDNDVMNMRLNEASRNLIKMLSNSFTGIHQLLSNTNAKEFTYQLEQAYHYPAIMTMLTIEFRKQHPTQYAQWLDKEPVHLHKDEGFTNKHLMDQYNINLLTVRDNWVESGVFSANWMAYNTRPYKVLIGLLFVDRTLIKDPSRLLSLEVKNVMRSTVDLLKNRNPLITCISDLNNTDFFKIIKTIPNILHQNSASFQNYLTVSQKLQSITRQELCHNIQSFVQNGYLVDQEWQQIYEQCPLAFTIVLKIRLSEWLAEYSRNYDPTQHPFLPQLLQLLSRDGSILDILNDHYDIIVESSRMSKVKKMKAWEANPAFIAMIMNLAPDEDSKSKVAATFVESIRLNKEANRFSDQEYARYSWLLMQSSESWMVEYMRHYSSSHQTQITAFMLEIFGDLNGIIYVLTKTKCHDLIKKNQISYYFMEMLDSMTIKDDGTVMVKEKELIMDKIIDSINEYLVENYNRLWDQNSFILSEEALSSVGNYLMNYKNPWILNFILYLFDDIEGLLILLNHDFKPLLDEGAISYNFILELYRRVGTPKDADMFFKMFHRSIHNAWVQDIALVHSLPDAISSVMMQPSWIQQCCYGESEMLNKTVEILGQQRTYLLIKQHSQTEYSILHFNYGECSPATRQMFTLDKKLFRDVLENSHEEARMDAHLTHAMAAIQPTISADQTGMKQNHSSTALNRSAETGEKRKAEALEEVVEEHINDRLSENAAGPSPRNQRS
jgi:hypothetical protein